jgi:hypothetical protein
MAAAVAASIATARSSLPSTIGEAALLPAPVVLADGIYNLDRTLELGPQHSGLVTRAAAGAKAWLSGGVEIQPAWQRVDLAANAGASRAADAGDGTGTHTMWSAAACGKLTGRGFEARFTIDSADNHPSPRLNRARYPSETQETDM